MTKSSTSSVEIVLLTGLSGAGKTTASDALEDSGSFCVDNLPASLLQSMVDFSRASGGKIARLCLGLMVREDADVQSVLRHATELREQGQPVEILFLDASEEVLLRRFSETRRRHPLDSGGEELDVALQRERRLLEPLRQAASLCIDTSELRAAELRARVIAHFCQVEPGELVIGVGSFGFKYGVPRSAHFVFDARFLPNPYFVDELRDHDGREAAVADYVFAHEDSGAYLEHMLHLLDVYLPLAREAQLGFVQIAIGCTGGRHRSVALSKALWRELVQRGYTCTEAAHRDVEK